MNAADHREPYLSDQTDDFIITNLDAMQNFLSDAQGRWSWEQMLYDSAFTAFRGLATVFVWSIAVVVFGLIVGLAAAAVGGGVSL